MPVLRLLLAPLVLAVVLTACEKPTRTPPTPKLDAERAGQPLPRTETPVPPASQPR